MTAPIDFGLCPSCGEPEADCSCAVDDSLTDLRMVEAFARHQPPLDLWALSRIDELTERGDLVEILDQILDQPGRESLRVYLDYATGRTFAVPRWVEDAVEVADVLAHPGSDPRTAAALTPWPPAPTIVTGDARPGGGSA